LRRVRAGELVAYRIASNALRFRPDDLEAYLAVRREGAHTSFGDDGTAPDRHEGGDADHGAADRAPERARAG
jgi:hypothetical protein